MVCMRIKIGTYYIHDMNLSISIQSTVMHMFSTRKKQWGLYEANTFTLHTREHTMIYFHLWWLVGYGGGGVVFILKYTTYVHVVSTYVSNKIYVKLK